MYIRTGTSVHECPCWDMTPAIRRSPRNLNWTTMDTFTHCHMLNALSGMTTGSHVDISYLNVSGFHSGSLLPDKDVINVYQDKALQRDAELAMWQVRERIQKQHPMEPEFEAVPKYHSLDIVIGAQILNASDVFDFSHAGSCFPQLGSVRVHFGERQRNVCGMIRYEHCPIRAW